jgi:trk system potassium uptake protein TrkA
MSCLLAKELGVAQTVVNIARPDYASLVQKFGIDLALSPRHVMASQILMLASGGRVRNVMLLEDGSVEVIELRAEHGGAMLEKPLSELRVPKGALIAAIARLGKTIIPRGQDAIEPGDTVVIVGLREAIETLEDGLRGR